MDKKHITDFEDAEFGVDSRYFSQKEKDSESVALMEFRLTRMKKLSKEQIIQAKLLQLKLKMERYLNDTVTGQNDNFSVFLQTYIDIIYSKRNSFAKDINIEPVLLSQIINHHREPNEDFIKRLMIHSEIAYKTISPFPKEIWFQIYYNDKICRLMSSQKDWKSTIESQVKVSHKIG